MTIRSTSARRRARKTGRWWAVPVVVVLAAANSGCQVESFLYFDCPQGPGVSTTLTSDVRPDSVAPGGSVSHRIAMTGFEPAVEVPLIELRLGLAVPPQVDRIDGVSFADAGATTSWTVENGVLELVIHHEPPAMPWRLPEITVAATVRADASPGSMEWPAPLYAEIGAMVGAPVTMRCTRVPGTDPINTSNVAR